MGNVIRLQQRKAVPEIAKPRGEACEIVIFPGVRIERWQPASGGPPRDLKARRRGARKSGQTR